MTDNVNHPSHYTNGEVECIDAIKSAASGADVNAYGGYLWLNTFKYIFRWPHKNGIEDLKKAQWYLNRLINDLEGDTK